MNQYTGAAIGGVVGALIMKRVLDHREENDMGELGEVETFLALASAALIGARVGHHFISPRLAAQSNPKGCVNTGKLAPQAVALLSTVNPERLYRKEVTDQLQIGPVYDNEKTVGTF